MIYHKLNPEQSWPWPLDQPTLGEHDVHIWRASLQVLFMYVQRLSKLLSRDEITRASQFCFDNDRHNFIVGRAFLRIIIGHYLRVEPPQLRFEYGKHGKPSLAKAFKDDSRLEFNLSHVGKLALYGFARERQIGIDLEQIHPDFPTEEIARSVFSQSEIAALSSLPLVAQKKAFFNCWVRKEAFVKAKGNGLSLDLDRFDVSLGPEQPVLRRVRWDEKEANRWSIRPIEVGEKYAAAIAVEGHNCQFHCWNAGSLAHGVSRAGSASYEGVDDCPVSANEGLLQRE